MENVRSIFFAMAGIFVILGGALLVMYFSKGAGSYLSGIAALIMAVAMTIIGNSLGKARPTEED